MQNQRLDNLSQIFKSATRLSHFRFHKKITVAFKQMSRELEYSIEYIARSSDEDERNLYDDLASGDLTSPPKFLYLSRNAKTKRIVPKPNF